MIDDAEKHREEDLKKKEEIDVKNGLDTIVYQVENLKNQHAETLTPDIVTSLDEALNEGKAALLNGSIDEIKAATEKLQNASINASIQIQEAMQPPDESADVKPTPDTVDADFEEVSP